ncbi:MAG: 4'-phosphopantetheinyl transferase superfamily protein [Chloroflexi bacterium]|nr:4'-phosphopantetheinyl transferase superfamily protein [Chloroflexota bacterium]
MRQPELDALLPPGIVAAVRYPEDGGSLDLLPEEQALLSPRAVPKRRLDFALGRAAAHEALRAFGVADEPIGKGPKGEPLWPAGIVGSISHCEGLAAAALARVRRYRGLGLDVEPLDQALDHGVAERVCHPSELDIGPAELTPMQRLLAVFSAKEAVYKAVFPVDRVFLDFLDAELRWLPEVCAFDAHMSKGSVRELRIRLGWFGRWLVTAAGLAAEG